MSSTPTFFVSGITRADAEAHKQRNTLSNFRGFREAQRPGHPPFSLAVK